MDQMVCFSYIYITFNNKISLIYVVPNVGSFGSFGSSIDCGKYWRLLNNTNGFDWQYNWRSKSFIGGIKPWKEYNINNGDNGPWVATGKYKGKWFKATANKKDFARSTLVRTIEHYFGL